ncbi:MAG: ATP-binding cassette domain-containing protein [Rhodoglobus sp.]
MSLAAELRLNRDGFELDLSLDLAPGRTLALLGPNGAGKSTALGVIAGIVASESSISLGGRAIGGLDAQDRRVGYVFQDYLLFAHLTVLENVAFGPRAQRMPRAAACAAAAQWLARLGVADLAPRRPAELSGGQAQRVALARALAAEPELLLLDEPLAALDAQVRPEVREQLARHLRDWGGLTIVVTHSLDDVAALADEVIVIEGGRATQRGTLREIVHAPASAYISRLVTSWGDD